MWVLLILLDVIICTALVFFLIAYAEYRETQYWYLPQPSFFEWLKKEWRRLR